MAAGVAPLAQDARRIARLVEALDKGIITDAEFTRELEQILAWALHDHVLPSLQGQVGTAPATAAAGGA